MSASRSEGSAESKACDPVTEAARHFARENADIREGMRAHRREPSWCPAPVHGYGCEPSDCPCGHTLRCDCWEIANER